MGNENMKKSSSKEKNKQKCVCGVNQREYRAKQTNNVDVG